MFSRRPAFVAVVQAADLRDRHDLPQHGDLVSSTAPTHVSQGCGLSTGESGGSRIRQVGLRRAAGLEPETVDLVVFSQAHPDHIGGTLDEAGNLAFPNARFVMLRAEFDYWREAAIQDRLAAGELYGAGPIEQLILGWFRQYLPPIESRLELLEGDAEVAPGVHVIPATGHTPGHLVVMVSSGRQQLLYVGDALLHPAQAGRPEWNCLFETDRRLAAETRRQLLDRASADRCLLAATHLPAVSRVVRRGSEYTLDS